MGTARDFVALIPFQTTMSLCVCACACLCTHVCQVRPSLSTQARQMLPPPPPSAHAPFSIILFCSPSDTSREEQENPAEITTQIASNQRYSPRRLGKNTEALMPPFQFPLLLPRPTRAILCCLPGRRPVALVVSFLQAYLFGERTPDRVRTSEQ